MKFSATVLLERKTATGVEVPPEVVDGLGSHKRPAVRVTINGYTYRSTIATMGGRFMIPVSSDVRAHTGVAAGDEIDVDVELDTEPREVEIPADLAAALASSDAARTAFEALTYSKQRAIVLNVDGAKTSETRQRRIDKALLTLAEGRA